MKFSDQLREQFNMDCQWSNNGFRGYPERSESDYLRGGRTKQV